MPPARSPTPTIPSPGPAEPRNDPCVTQPYAVRLSDASSHPTPDRHPANVAASAHALRHRNARAGARRDAVADVGAVRPRNRRLLHERARRRRHRDVVRPDRRARTRRRLAGRAGAAHALHDAGGHLPTNRSRARQRHGDRRVAQRHWRPRHTCALDADTTAPRARRIHVGRRERATGGHRGWRHDAGHGAPADGAGTL